MKRKWQDFQEDEVALGVAAALVGVFAVVTLLAVAAFVFNAPVF